MSEESSATLSRISVRIKNGEISLNEDSFDTEAKDIIFKVKEPEKLPGYKLKYVMRNKISQVTARPQDKSEPIAFDYYAVYLNKSERLPLLTKITEEIEGKLKSFQTEVNDSLIKLVKFRREKIPAPKV
jgi:hypothetical protein